MQTFRKWPVLIIMAVVLFGCGAAPEPTDNAHAQVTPDKTIVYILAGQSNMDGRGDGSKLTADDRRRLENVQNRVHIAYNGKAAAPLDVSVPPKHTARKFNLEKTFGPEVFFGIGIAEARPDSEILLIKRSRGGMSLYGAWNSDWSADKAAVMNEAEAPKLYAELLKSIDLALKDKDPQAYEFAGMLWVQGETDSGVRKFGPVAAETYGANLKKLISTIRTDTEVPDLPFYMLQVGSGKVVEGMRDTANTVPNVHFIAQSKKKTAPNYLPGYGPPIGHYNYEGVKRIGEMFADTVIKAESKQP